MTRLLNTHSKYLLFVKCMLNVSVLFVANGTRVFSVNLHTVLSIQPKVEEILVRNQIEQTIMVRFGLTEIFGK